MALLRAVCWILGMAAVLYSFLVDTRAWIVAGILGAFVIVIEYMRRTYKTGRARDRAKEQHWRGKAAARRFREEYGTWSTERPDDPS